MYGVCVSVRLRMRAKACIEVLTSKRLPRIMEVVLELGNFLNEKTNRGNAWGYTLGSLLKVG